jgi:hypothetical protein
MVSAPMDDPETVQKIAGQAPGEIATAAYDPDLRCQAFHRSEGASGLPRLYR